MTDQFVPIPPVRTGYLKLADTSLYYRDYGEDTARHTLLLLHGNGESWHCFARQVGPFSEAGYRVITLDSRGHGSSGRGSLPMTPQQLAADALDALTLLGFPRRCRLDFGRRQPRPADGDSASRCHRGTRRRRSEPRSRRCKARCTAAL